MFEAVEYITYTESELSVMEPPTMVRDGIVVHHHLFIDFDGLCYLPLQLMTDCTE